MVWAALPWLAMSCASPHHLVHDIDPEWREGALSVVVEIPAGTTAKWEVDKVDGVLRHEVRDGAPRVVDYLGYPGNYGMVPGTLSPQSEGGDGDPLDVLVLGPSAERGEVLRVRPIAVLELADGGETDDKIVAVPIDDVRWARIGDLAELERAYPGVRAIVELWFVNYKGIDVIEVRGWGGVAEARVIVERALAAYDTKPNSP